MGSRLAVLAALIAIAVARPAAADKAGDLVKRGLAAYKAGKYAAAADALEKAYRIDPKPDTLFAWAQAERLLGDCEAAIPLYKKLLDQTPDLNGGRLVRENLALCEPAEPEPEKEKEKAKEAPPPPPPPEEHEVKPEPEPDPEPIRTPPQPAKVIEHRGAGGAAIAMIAAGTAGVGVGVGFFIASGNSADAADHARTVEDYDRLQSRADSQRTISFIAGGAGVALVATGIVLAIRHSGTHETTAPAVSITPTPGGATVFVRGGF